MRLQILSDLHMECYRGEMAPYGEISADPRADAFVLAGDISIGWHSWAEATRLARRSGRPVFWVPGNHEFYGKDYRKLMRQYRAAKEEGVYALLDRAVELDGVRFCGATLWTDFGLYVPSVRLPDVKVAMAQASRGINDFRVIEYGDGQFEAATSRRVHLRSRAFLKRTLESPFDGPTVVVTHHGPSGRSIHPRFAPTPGSLESPVCLEGENPWWQVNACFVSNMPELVEKASLWVHGHTHDSFDYNEGSCRVVANPRGYPLKFVGEKLILENRSFAPNLLVDV